MPLMPMSNKKIPASRRKREFPRNLIYYAALTAAAILFLNFVARFTAINGPSMEPTLRNGDIVLVWQLRYNPAPGDIVVTGKSNPLGVRIVKRVAAVGGQTIRIKDGCLHIDGRPLPESYFPKAGDFPETLVPGGYVFLLGDNRRYSTDSREIGCVPEQSLMGKVLLRVFPFSEFGSVDD